MKRLLQRLACFLIALASSCPGQLVAQPPPDNGATPATTEPASQLNLAPPRVLASPPLAPKEIAKIFESKSSDDLDRLNGETASPPNSPSQASDPATPLEAPPKSVDELIDQLGSTEFAVRERTTADLRKLGADAITELQNTAQQHPDLEVRVRAADVAASFDQGQTAGRIDAFLAGESTSLPGWNVVQKILGDGIRKRELFVDMSMRHSPLMSALTKTPQQRGTALKESLLQIQKGMFIEGRQPSEADVIAILLGASDPKTEFEPVAEDALIGILRRPAAGLLIRDQQLKSSFKSLLGAWILRSSTANRNDTMWFALGWEIPEVLDIAYKVLGHSDDLEKSAPKESNNSQEGSAPPEAPASPEAPAPPEDCVMAAQAITQFGTPQDIAILKRLLVDERPATDAGYAGGTVVQTQVRDAAMAAIVILSQRKLSEFGMNDKAITPRYAFIASDVGFPIEDDKPREAVLKKIKDELLNNTP